mmetsp:Transcript_20593/g.41416  ORF Transcript_20593/g.41416 Transcript_20593/m.41416 type:complete len:347 (-) Transcript_20593:300-1340(-)
MTTLSFGRFSGSLFGNTGTGASLFQDLVEGRVQWKSIVVLVVVVSIDVVDGAKGLLSSVGKSIIQSRSGRIRMILVLNNIVITRSLFRPERSLNVAQFSPNGIAQGAKESSGFLVGGSTIHAIGRHRTDDILVLNQFVGNHVFLSHLALHFRVTGSFAFVPVVGIALGENITIVRRDDGNFTILFVARRLVILLAQDPSAFVNQKQKHEEQHSRNGNGRDHNPWKGLLFHHRRWHFHYFLDFLLDYRIDVQGDIRRGGIQIIRNVDPLGTSHAKGTRIYVEGAIVPLGSVGPGAPPAVNLLEIVRGQFESGYGIALILAVLVVVDELSSDVELFAVDGLFHDVVEV